MKRVRERESDVGEVLRGNLLVSEECSKAPGWERSQNRGPRVGPYSRSNPKIGGLKVGILESLGKITDLKSALLQ